MNSGLKRKIVVSVSNDLSTDQRVERVCGSLLDMDFDIVLVGRQMKSSVSIVRKYPVKRMKLMFNKGPLFYANLNFRLLWMLIKEKPDVLLANDLDTLMANYLYHRWSSRKTTLVYDSHEYFTEVPELINRRARSVWLRIEQWIFPKLDKVYTVSSSIASAYSQLYHVPVAVVRNLPILNVAVSEGEKIAGEKKLIYQGAINVNRGIELMVSMMRYLPDYHLYIFGDGDIYHDIVALVEELALGGNVKMMGSKMPNELRGYTRQCDLGLSFEEDMGLSYRYALPNKIFDYIHADVPVLCSDLPQMRGIVDEYNVGQTLESRAAKDVATQVRLICEGALHQEYKTRCKVAKEALCWQEEEKKLFGIYSAG